MRVSSCLPVLSLFCAEEVCSATWLRGSPGKERGGWSDFPSRRFVPDGLRVPDLGLVGWVRNLCVRQSLHCLFLLLFCWFLDIPIWRRKSRHFLLGYFT